jgi:excisionase family DNA binding protein
MASVTDEFLTVAEVAELLRLNQQTIRNWIDRGSLPAVRIGRRVRVRGTDLRELLERGEASGRSPKPGPGFTADRFWAGELPPDPIILTNPE